jgi:16S rRNA (cytidine1402-2'-O)-methyltransferase
MADEAARGRLYVVSTPIGNLEDMSPRAVRVLREADWIACEDTRETAKLCTHFAIGTRRISLHAHNEAKRAPALVQRLVAGESGALVSDAGTPLLSDPGARLVASALEARVEVVPVPGASALLAALVASGLPAQPFAFLGFPPRAAGARRDWMARAAALPGTLVLFEAPSRVNATLCELAEALGPRRCALARELTKRFEQVLRGRLGSLRLEEARGECVIVIEGPVAGPPAHDEAELDRRIRSALDQGQSPGRAARELSASLGLPRTLVYSRALSLSRD